jgi:hypothetical protein
MDTPSVNEVKVGLKIKDSRQYTGKVIISNLESYYIEQFLIKLDLLHKVSAKLTLLDDAGF